MAKMAETILAALGLLPDAPVRFAIDHGEIYSEKELPLLTEMLDRGEKRQQRGPVRELPAPGTVVARERCGRGVDGAHRLPRGGAGR